MLCYQEHDGLWDKERSAAEKVCVCVGGATDRGRGSEEAPLCRLCVVRDAWCLVSGGSGNGGGTRVKARTCCVRMWHTHSGW